MALLLGSHDVRHASECGWQRLTNGKLLAAAEGEGFEALLTVDRNMARQQNLQDLPVAVIPVEAPSNSLRDLRPAVPKIASLLEQRLQRRVYTVSAK
jgi:hypothetical protein